LEHRGAALKTLLAEANQVQSSDDQLVKADELVRPQVVSSQVALREQPVLQREEPRSAMRQEPQRAPLEQQQGQPRVHFAPEQLQEQPVSQRGQLAARLAQRRAQQASQRHWVSLPRAPQEPQAASGQPWLQLPSLRLPPWHQLPP
jgi:hypothetical protein